MSEWEEALDRAMEVRARSARRQSSAARARNRSRNDAMRGVPRPPTCRSAPCGTTTGYRYGCRCSLCSEAKHAENARRSFGPDAGRRARERARQTAERSALHRADQYRQAVVAARGELARLIAEQAADDETWRSWSKSLEAFPDWSTERADVVQWDDPTADAALERVA